MKNNRYATGFGLALLIIGIVFSLLRIHPEGTIYVVGGITLMAISKIKMAGD